MIILNEQKYKFVDFLFGSISSRLVSPRSLPALPKRLEIQPNFLYDMEMPTQTTIPFGIVA